MKKNFEAYEAINKRFSKEKEALEVKFLAEVKGLITKELAKLEDGEEASVSSGRSDDSSIPTGEYTDAFNRIDKNGEILIYNNHACEDTLAYSDKVSIFDMNVEIQLETLYCLIKHNEKKTITADEILHWHGSDHGIEELAEVLADVINGEYDINQARQEIKDSND